MKIASGHTMRTIASTGARLSRHGSSSHVRVGTWRVAIVARAQCRIAIDRSWSFLTSWHCLKKKPKLLSFDVKFFNFLCVCVSQFLRLRTADDDGDKSGRDELVVLCLTFCFSFSRFLLLFVGSTTNSYFLFHSFRSSFEIY